ncbi:MAG: glycosyltransferase, partial [Planctomycetota bacterium]
FCLPSHFEGTGLVAVEAAAFGAAVVITKNGGPPDYFLNHAEYVSRGDADEIAAATQKAWDRYGETELRERVLNTLTWAKSAEALAAAYEKHCLGD